MTTVKISPKFQVVIPRDVRVALRLIPGQRLQVVAYGNRIELIPEKRLSKMQGFLKGIDTRIDREEDRV